MKILSLKKIVNVKVREIIVLEEKEGKKVNQLKTILEKKGDKRKKWRSRGIIKWINRYK